MRRKRTSISLSPKEKDLFARLSFAFNTDGHELMGFVEKHVEEGQNAKMILSPYWKEKLGLEYINVIRLKKRTFKNSDIQYMRVTE